MFTKGQKVTIINTKLNGEFFVEGEAHIMRAIDEDESVYVVNFSDGMGGVQRFVDEAAQDNPTEYVKQLNAGEAA